VFSPIEHRRTIRALREIVILNKGRDHRPHAVNPAFTEALEIVDRREKFDQNFTSR
jgi:hypothetical protein